MVRATAGGDVVDGRGETHGALLKRPSTAVGWRESGWPGVVPLRAKGQWTKYRQWKSSTYLNRECEWQTNQSKLGGTVTQVLTVCES